jgi:hypothetical protein
MVMNVAPLRLVVLGMNIFPEQCTLYTTMYLVSMYNF